MKTALSCTFVAALAASPASSQCIVSRFPHTGVVPSIAIDKAPGRTKLATVGELGVRIYDTDTAEELLFVPNADEMQFEDVALSENRLAIGHPLRGFSYFGSVFIHHAISGNLIAEITDAPGFDDFFGRQVELRNGHFVVREPDFKSVAAKTHFYRSFTSAPITYHEPVEYEFPRHVAIGMREGLPVFASVWGSTTYVYHDASPPAAPLFLGSVTTTGVVDIAIEGGFLAIATLDGVDIHDVPTLGLVTVLPLPMSFGGRVCFSDGLLSAGTATPTSAGPGRILVYDQTTWTPIFSVDGPPDSDLFGLDACMSGDRLATYVEIDGVPEIRVYAVPRPGSAGWPDCAWDNYCSPVAANSTGVPSQLSCTGSEVARDESLTLKISGAPPGNVCLFLASTNRGFFPTPGTSCGNLCLRGPDIARFKFDAQVIDDEGCATLEIDPFVVLTNPPQPILSGQTWNFQAWHRDADALPDCNNNFTEACSITFR